MNSLGRRVYCSRLSLLSSSACIFFSSSTIRMSFAFTCLARFSMCAFSESILSARSHGYGAFFNFATTASSFNSSIIHSAINSPESSL